MKHFIAISILFYIFAGNAHAALTDADIDKIRIMLNEEIAPIKADIAIMKTDAATRDTEIANLKETMKDGFNTVQKQFDRQNNIIIACIGIPLAIFVTIWTTSTRRQEKKEDNLKKEIQTLRQEFETFKQQRIINQ